MRPRFSVRFAKREKTTWRVQVLIPVICVFLALAVSGLIIAAQGFDPFAVYGRLFKNAFGSGYSIGESVLQAIPLIFCALGVSVAFRMSLSNIGAEGQYAMGAFAAVGVALFCPLPQGLTLPAMVLAGFCCGAAWALIAILPRIIWGVNETLVTLMLNYVALLFVNYWCYGPWREQGKTNMPYSDFIPDYAQFTAFPGTRLHTGLLLALGAAVLLYFFYRSTTMGYQMQVIGKNARAAQYAGIPVKRNIVFAMLLSGGLAGLAGVAQIGGVLYRLQPDIPNGAGYTAIIIAYMAHLNPFVCILVSILFGGLTQGGFSMQIMGVSSKIVTMIQGMILLFVLGGEIFAKNRLLIKFHREKVGGD